MHPQQLAVTSFFDGQKQYLIPIFQRGFVWSLNKQIASLWLDIEDRANELVSREAVKTANLPLKELQKHFLGSVILNPSSNLVSGIRTYEVIDGQQRTTTLHLLLLALLHATRELQPEDFPYSTTLESLVRNRVHNPGVDSHKVWPTQAGQDEMQFLDNVEGPVGVIERFPAKEGRTLIQRPLMIQAYLYFYFASRAFLRGLSLDDVISNESDESNELSYSDWLIHAITHKNQFEEMAGSESIDPNRATFLYRALEDGVQIMTLTLAPEDDPQVIFETLNARGEPLLASDLVRNFIFLAVAKNKLNVNDLYAKYWSSFDIELQNNKSISASLFWREDERQGRLKRPRVDLFFYYYTILRRVRETKANHIFEGFKEWWNSDVNRDIESELKRLIQSSNFFRELTDSDGSGYIAEFAKLIKAFEVSTLTPLYLALRERYLDPKAPELIQVLSYLSSYVVRRSVCGLTAKSYNNTFLKLLEIFHEEQDPVPAIRSHLLKMTGDATRWPDDAEFNRAWMVRGVYKVLGSGRVGEILRAIESSSRTSKHETQLVPELSCLSVEHILPQKWKQSGHYQITNMTQDQEEARDNLLHTFGNLTLLTQELNSSLKNGPFVDCKDTEGKKSKIINNSLLGLNSYFHKCEEWNDQEILARGKYLLDRAKRIWAHIEL